MTTQTLHTVVFCQDVCVNGQVSNTFALLDVRTPAEYSGGHIPGSVNVPLDQLDRRLEEVKGLAEGRHVAIVCRSGNRARQAFAILDKAGFGEVSVLEGGMLAWEESNHPVLKPASGRAVLSLDRQVRIVAGSMVLGGSVLAAVVSPWFLLLTGFVGSGLIFAGVTDTCGMATILAKMPWNQGSNTGVTCKA